MRRFRRWLESLGAAGVLGLGILISCAFFFGTVVLPAERQLQAQRSDAQRLQDRSSQRPTSADPRADRLPEFQNLFPPLNTLSDELERLYAAARDADLRLRQAEYRLEGRGSGLTAYRITLPVHGSYLQLRRFLDTVLRDMPITSVDGLRFERKKAAEAQLDAEVRLTIHFRPAEADRAR